jgi:hypothetical protein
MKDDAELKSLVTRKMSLFFNDVRLTVTGDNHEVSVANRINVHDWEDLHCYTV